MSDNATAELESGTSNDVGSSTRMDETENDSDKNNGQQPEILETITDDLICPITHELPIEPVTAKDGHVYEKSAIEQHFQVCRENNRPITSPMTNLVMEEELLPNPKAKSLSQKLVNLGLVTGDLATSWNRRVQEQNEVEDLLRRAYAGDADAMCTVAVLYQQGSRGIAKNQTNAYSWMHRASMSGSVKGQALLGFYRVYGIGVVPDEKGGMRDLALAACQGSRFAAFFIGVAYKNGYWGMTQDVAKAATFFRKALEPSSCNDLSEATQEEARNHLAELSR